MAIAAVSHALQLLPQALRLRPALPRAFALIVASFSLGPSFSQHNGSGLRPCALMARRYAHATIVGHCPCLPSPATPAWCRSGRHVVHLSKYFQPPGQTLSRLLRGSSPTGKNDMEDSFSAPSRKYDALCALAQHKIQANTPEREIKLHTPHAPANVCIHGTMYRNVSLLRQPLGVFYFDPRARDAVAQAQHLDRAVAKQAEKKNVQKLTCSTPGQQQGPRQNILPAFGVPGSPRHLRKLRVDALEIARRRPTYMVHRSDLQPVLARDRGPSVPRGSEHRSS